MGRWGDGEIGRLGDWQIGRLGDWEMGRWGDGEIGRLGDCEIGRLGDWEIGRLADWEIGCIRYLPKSNHQINYYSFFINYFSIWTYFLEIHLALLYSSSPEDIRLRTDSRAKNPYLCRDTLRGFITVFIKKEYRDLGFKEEGSYYLGEKEEVLYST